MFKEKQKRGLMREGEGEDQILEINLISAQGLKTPSGSRRRVQTYAVAWIDPSTKLRTQVDRVGAENPTWNDKFLFRVSSDFISCETSGVVVEIYALGYIRDYLVGTVRLLLSSCLGKPSASGNEIETPAFTAVQIRRPSGRFHGVLNIAAAISSSKSADLEIFHGSSAISFGDLAGVWTKKEKEKENGRQGRRLSRIGSRESVWSSGAESGDLDLSSLELSDGTESTCTTTSSTSPPASNSLKEWNGVSSRIAGTLKELNSEGVGGGGAGMLCGLILQRRIPSNQNLRFWDDSN